MKRLFIPAILFLAACATQPSSDFQSGDADAAIRANNAAFAAAMNSANIDGVMSAYADDAIVLPANSPAFKGKDAIKQFWSGFMGMGALNLALFAEDVMQQGDLAVETGRYEASITPKGAGAIKDNGKYVVVWRKIGGQWKIVRDMFSTDLPAPK